MNKKVTKDQLLEENGRLKLSVEALQSESRTMREELSITLEAPRESKMYGDGDIKIYSWSQIFSEIGKLKSRVSHREVEDGLERVSDRLYKLEDKVFPPSPN